LKYVKGDAGLKQAAVYGLIALVALFSLLPFAVFGPDSIITVFDNLDGMVPIYKMSHDDGLFFKFDAPTRGFSGMSTLYYAQINYSFQSLMYSIFDDFIAYTLSYYCSVVFGFIFMYILLKKTLGFSPVISIFMAICYALLPVVPIWNIAAGTLPFIIVVFFYFASQKNNILSWKSLLLLFYPFFSSFTAFGIFILGFWFLGLIILSVKNKKVNPNLLIGFFLLYIGYILVDLRLFYVMFVLKTPLNRAVFADTMFPADIIAQIKILLKNLKTYGLDGYYHATSFQRKIIVPTVFFVSCAYLIKLFFTNDKGSETGCAKIKKPY
jgi:hypothetical protein